MSTGETPRHGATSPVGDDPSTSMFWVCKVCDTSNSISRPGCEVCDTPRPASPRAETAPPRAARPAAPGRTTGGTRPPVAPRPAMRPPARPLPASRAPLVAVAVLFALVLVTVVVLGFRRSWATGADGSSPSAHTSATVAALQSEVERLRQSLAAEQTARADAERRASDRGIAASVFEQAPPNVTVRDLQGGGPEVVESLVDRSGCSGYLTADPVMTVDLERPSVTQVWAAADAAISLVVQAPDGRWYCGPGGEGRTSVINLGMARPGAYRIWIATTGSPEPVPARFVAIALPRP